MYKNTKHRLQKMNLYIIVLCVLGVVEFSTAMPIPPISFSTIGEQNTIFVGVLALISMTAVLLACVCCRRRKKGFELNQPKDRKEFENESGLPDSAPSTTSLQQPPEFPIFRALSTSSSSSLSAQPPPPLPQNSIYNKNDNLIMKTNQQHTLSNERLPVINVTSIPIQYNEIKNGVTLDIDTTNFIEITPITLDDIKTKHNISNNPFLMNSNGTAINYNNYAKDIDNSSITSTDSIILQVLDEDNNSQLPMTKIIDNDNEIQINVEYDGDNIKIIKDEMLLQQTCPNINIIHENISRKNSSRSLSSDINSGNDILSVEEALRALDFAISGEEESIQGNNSNNTNNNNNNNKNNNNIDDVSDDDDDNENNIDNTDIDLNKENNNGLKELLISTTTTNASPQIPTPPPPPQSSSSITIVKDINVENLKLSYENIREEAKLFVDSIMNKCQEIINLKIQQNDHCNINNNTVYDNFIQTSFCLNECNKIISGNGGSGDASAYSNTDDLNSSSLNETVIDLGKTYNNNNKNNVNNNTYLYEENSQNIDNINNKPEQSSIIQNDISSSPAEQFCYNKFNKLNMESSTPFIDHKFMRNEENWSDNKKHLFYDLNDSEQQNNNNTFTIDLKNNSNMIEIKKVQNESLESPSSSSSLLIALENNNNNTNTTTNIDDFQTTINLEYPIIKIDKDNEIISEDLTTVTPVNTPIELNYSNETWDTFILNNKEQINNNDNNLIDMNQPSTSSASGQQQKSKNNTNGWFLHPQQQQQQQQQQKPQLEEPIPSTSSSSSIQNHNNDTFNINMLSHYSNYVDDYDYDDDDDDDYDEEDEINRNLTFDALRKQLEEVLPHAQGNVTGPPEFSDDEDDYKDDKNQRTFDEYRTPLEMLLSSIDDTSGAGTSNSSTQLLNEGTPQTEMFINYKRTLSPILEESEEETCKTFVLNETKCLDSTSTGCIESGEAIMGVTKTLMASNDTLFNFEDTLGERDDIFSSPRISATIQNQCKTPTNDLINQNETIIISNNENEQEKLRQFKPIELSNDYANNTYNNINNNNNNNNNINDNDDDVNDNNNYVLSPEQQKTFSDEDITTNTPNEHVSSELSGAIDTTFTTNTIEEKTCISIKQHGNILKHDDERISEISEPDWDLTGSCNNVNDMNSLADVPSLDILSTNSNDIINIIDNNNNNNNNNNNINSCDNDQYKIIHIIKDDAIIKQIHVDNNLPSSSQAFSVTKSPSPPPTQSPSTPPSSQSPSPPQNLPSPSPQSPSSLTVDNHESEDSEINIDEDSNIENKIDNHQKNIVQNFLNYEINYSSNTSNNSGNNNNNNNNNNDVGSVNTKNTYSTASQYLNEINSSKNVHNSNCDNIKENKDPNVKHCSNNNDTERIVDNEQIIEAEPLFINNYSLNKINNNNNNNNYNNNNNNNNNNETENILLNHDIFSQPDIIIDCNERFRPEVTKHKSIINNYTVHEIGSLNDQNCVIVTGELINQLSGEEDPWVNQHPITDIRFSGPCSEIMSTSFTTNEWDSDIEDDSNSSEEFMYVKGTPRSPPSPTTNSSLYKTTKYEQNNSNHSPSALILEEDNMNDNDIWNSHEDQIQIVKENENGIASTDNNFEDTSSCSEDVEEGEWVPSCWDSMAQPARSALKSPDKSSSKTKKRRSVAFKKQNYHSVYEYPKEVISLSPSYSEPQLWNNRKYLNSNYEFDANSTAIGTHSTSPQNHEFSHLIDGFSVSSSTRPFHHGIINNNNNNNSVGSQFSTQCHTWPCDSDFSWSQIQDNEKYNHHSTYSEYPIEWPKSLEEFLITDDNIKDTNDIESTSIRSDSGVGESAEHLLSDSISLGDLCHTKSSLKLPLNILPMSKQFNQQQQQQQDESPTDNIIISKNIDDIGDKDEICSTLNYNKNKEDNNAIETTNRILPTTPSCTSSMDSLSSSSGSERQICNFKTFGKQQQQQQQQQNLSSSSSLSSTSPPSPPLLPLLPPLQSIQPQPETIGSLHLIENENINDTNATTTILLKSSTSTINKQKQQHNDKSIKQNDSTDEDSGIESIIRIAK